MPDRRKSKSAVIGMDSGTQIQLHSMLIPGMVIMIVFSIVPLFGVLVAFKNFRPVMGFTGIFISAFNNFANFTQVFKSSQFIPMMKNTIGINILGQLISLPATLLFALLLNEIRSVKFRSFVQTVTYLPHFLSWVIFGGLCINILSPDGGVINQMLTALGLVKEPVLFLAKPQYFWMTAILTGLVKDIGWGAIIYLAAIAGIDPTLYESATVDGAGRFRKIWHITIPSILPTLMIMIIFAIAGILNNNFTQIYVFQNSLNQPASQVIDTYVYQMGLQQFQFGVASAVSLMKSVIAVILLVSANFASKKLTQSGLF
jgi:putative aldouronate transport system permease protein